MISTPINLNTHVFECPIPNVLKFCTMYSILLIYRYNFFVFNNFLILILLLCSISIFTIHMRLIWIYMDYIFTHKVVIPLCRVSIFWLMLFGHIQLITGSTILGAQYTLLEDHLSISQTVVDKHDQSYVHDKKLTKSVNRVFALMFFIGPK